MADELQNTDQDGSGYGLADQTDNTSPSTVQTSGVRRDVGDIPDARLELVKQTIKDVKRAKKFWDKDFKRMRKNQDFLIGLQWQDQTDIDDEERYVANITQRHIQQRTAAIYAKNPTVVARRKVSLDFKLWDENPLTAQMAMQAVSMAAQAMAGAQQGNPQAQAAVASMPPDMGTDMAMGQALLADIQQGYQRRLMMDKIARTVEAYFKNRVLTQQFPPFKASMKQLVRRTMACGIGYLKLGFIRDMEMNPDVLKGMATAQEQMATIERMMADITDDDPNFDDLNAEKENLRLALEALKNAPRVISQEGIVFDFPSATSIIPDWRLQQIEGFVGCDFVGEEFLLTPDQIQEIWKVDVKTGEGGSCTYFDPESNEQMPVKSDADKDEANKRGLCCVWIVYNRKTGLTYTVCDGYKDFLEDPCPPKVTLERFWPWFPLAFNQLEHHKQKFPLSDVFLIKHQQREMNRAREALREHRIANRPLTVVAGGTLSDDDKKKIETRPANAVVFFDGLAQGQKVEDLLQVVKHPGLNPDLYETESTFGDVLKIVGAQEANLGGTTNGATATQSSIAESSRLSSLQSNMDDMDDFLTDVMRAAGQLALLEISAQEVTQVCGQGAVWPTLSREEIAHEILLEIQAGSSGRPNKAVEVQNMTQAMPFLLQIPGVSPQWLLKQLMTRLDDRLDLTDAFLEGQPSIQTLNALAAKAALTPPETAGQGPGAADPGAQGAKGALNAPSPGGAGGALGPQTDKAAPPPAGTSAPVPISS